MSKLISYARFSLYDVTNYVIDVIDLLFRNDVNTSIAMYTDWKG